jgi:hypothetical protein
MSLFFRSSFIAGIAAVLIWFSAVVASAQTPAALPTVPGAQRSVGTAPATSALASLPGDNGSPVEPYLFMFILAGGGIICFAATRFTNAFLLRDSSNETYAKFIIK